MAVERRKHVRRPLEVRLQWKPVVLDDQKPTAEMAGAGMREAVTVDFSHGGLSFFADEQQPVGSALALQLEREFEGPPLSALGRVARCKAIDGGWLLGVELTWVEATHPDAAQMNQPESAWTLL
jgi:hypothetical protein